MKSPKRMALLMVVLAVARWAGAEEDRLFLVRDGKPAASIVIPDHADAWTERAAQWLREYIQKATVAELPVVPEAQAPDGTLISVGHTQRAAQAGVDASGLKYDGCKTVVKGNVLYLLGRDIEKPIASNPLVGAHGTCRAVLMFLEDHAGVRWFLPSPEGELIPPTKDISVPRALSKAFSPAFAYSDGRATYTTDFLGVGGGTPASLANNFRSAVTAYAGGHTYYAAVPAQHYFQNHPEYFALIGGKRTGAGNHLCTSNPDVKRILIQWVQDRFDEGYEWVSIGQEDGFRRCECPDCEKLDDYRFESSGIGWDDFMYGALRKTPCERLFLLHKAVIDAAAESHPDRKVMLMCYAPTAWPSKKIDYFGDNVILELMNQEPEFLAAWKGKGAGITGYVYWFNVVTPMGFDVHATPREVAEKIRYLHRKGFVGLYQFAESGWGFQGPSFYVLGKVMGDPSLEADALVAEYCRGLYGRAADAMQEFFRVLYERHEKLIPLPVENFTRRMNRMPPEFAATSDLYTKMYPPQFLNRLEALLRKAEEDADTPRARGWVRLTREHLDFTALLTRAVLAHRVWKKAPTKDNWLAMRQRVEAFDAWRTKVITYERAYADTWFPGHDAFCNYLTADCQHESKVYYTPWEKRRDAALARGVKGVAIGYAGSPGYSFIKEPLTLDFTRPAPEGSVP